ncbi:homoserine O-acetyltransferase [Nakamurella sp. UYEF19]|uniref:alpha/beta fold hydrolase n=1 Tax=Nakamurella sp. UYEF19 TaxID=1756392 RepID=UPI0033982AC1
MTWPVESGTFELGDLAVERGGTIKDARLVWQTHGTLSPARDNVIVYPTSYSAQHDDLTWLIGPDQILDPERYFIVIVDMFSNGLSSGAADTPDFPSVVTPGDNVEAQRRLLVEQFGVHKVAAVYGFSMGAIQAYHWAARFGDDVERIFVVCGSARTSRHNRVFLSGLLRTLEAAPEHLGNGRFSAEPIAALRAFAHIYAGWGLSQDFYRSELYESALGYADLDSFLQVDWVESFGRNRAANLYAQAVTWSVADISDVPAHGGDLAAALRRITARVLLLPSDTDLYFRVADNEAELTHLTDAELRVIRGVWGHRAGNPRTVPDAFVFLQAAVRESLAR